LSEQQHFRYPDVKAVRVRARAEWERVARRKLGIQERIGESIPFWLIGIAVVFYMLSAPHTAGTFDLLTPGWGWAAPVGVELGTIYVAFRRYQLRSAHEPLPASLRGLGVMLTLIAVVVNGAGAFAAVISGIGLTTLPFTEIVTRFGGLPATSQVGLLLVPLAAIVIPLGATVAGEGVAALILERRERGDLMDQEWRRVRIEMEFVALRDSAVQLGIPPGQAARWAASLVRDNMPQVSALPSDTSDASGRLAAINPVENTSEVTKEPVRNGQLADGHGHGQGYGRNPKARDKVLTYLSENPSATGLSVRELAAASGVGKSVAAVVLSEYRERKDSSNHVSEYKPEVEQHD